MWAEKQAEEYPMPLYWQYIMSKQKILLRFTWSIREGNFLLYVQVCDEIAQLAVTLDLPNYSRDLPIHVRDMVQLSQNHPRCIKSFLRGSL